ncbi:MAG: kinase/pyrophosphorylase [Alphaproteobacteria bacterium]|nr:kinase/pyrophosphorylase [Alphaproteobacteria bacterium]MBM3952057.1 kinase/pyrophosphorylase [Rhodospirillales bacterium]
MTQLHVHVVSDSTGETAGTYARAAVTQFEGVELREHLWAMVRTESELDEALAGIRANPGFVMFTIVDEKLRTRLEQGCRELHVPSLAVLDPALVALGAFLGAETKARPGGQHVMDAEYFARIEAMQFTLAHDDGQSPRSLDGADVILVGVSRTSKTPTCIYLAQRGLKAANVPMVPGCPLPPELTKVKRALVVGLTKDPKRLVQIRRNRLLQLNKDQDTDYVDLEKVAREVNEARKLFEANGWPVIDVTRRSIEETAASIIQLHTRRREEQLA